MKENLQTDIEWDPVEFDLADGSAVKVVLGFFWTKVTTGDRALGTRPFKYLAIRVYSDEETHPRRVQQAHELIHGKDFEAEHCSKIWQWLVDHSASRERMDHDSLDDFLAVFESVIDKIQAEDEDMIEHLERLPAITLPDAFDQYDDSVFTDQRD